MTRIKTESRTLTNGAPGKSLYLLYDPRARKHHAAESYVEYEGLLTMLYDRNIVSMEVQPKGFTISDRDGEFKYTPDVRYVHGQGTIEYREFKEDFDALSPDDKERYRRIKAHLHRLGFGYSIEDARTWRIGHRLANIKLLYRYAGLEPDTALLAWLNQRLGPRPGSYDIWTFLSQLGKERLPALYRLLWEQSVAVDIAGAPLDDDSLLWRVQA
jgi:hypothetical protein